MFEYGPDITVVVDADSRAGCKWYYRCQGCKLLFGSISKSSVATNSDMEDLGNLIISLRKNLDVAVGDIPAALDILHNLAGTP